MTNKLVVSTKQYDWLLERFPQLVKQLEELQRAYYQEGKSDTRGYRGVSTEKLRTVQGKYGDRLARIREELRRRGE